MRKKIYIIFFLIFQFYFFIHKSYASSKMIIGYIENTLGEVIIIRGKKEINTTIGKQLYENDYIETKEKSVVKIKLLEGSDFVLFENSSLRIKEYSMKFEQKNLEEKSYFKAVLDKITGMNRFFIQHEHGRTNSISLQTGNSVLGIRGTGGFITAQTKHSTQIVVTEGEVELKNLNMTHKPVLVGKNQWGEIIDEAPPTSPQPVSPEMLIKLESLVPENFETTESNYKKDLTKENSIPKVKEKLIINEAFPVATIPANSLKTENKILDKQKSDKIPFLEVGPMVSAGLFNFLSFGAEIRFSRFIGVSANFGGAKDINILKINKFLSDPIKKNSVDGHVTEYKANFKHQEVRAVLYPFMGYFFIGAALGFRDIDGTPRIDITISNQLAKISGYYRVKNQYIAPQFGWLAVFDFGLAIGTEIGLQIPLTKGKADKIVTIDSNSGLGLTAITNSKVYTDLVTHINNIVNSIQSKTLPYWNILTIGWLF